MWDKLQGSFSTWQKIFTQSSRRCKEPRGTPARGVSSWPIKEQQGHWEGQGENEERQREQDSGREGEGNQESLGLGQRCSAGNRNGGFAIDKQWKAKSRERTSRAINRPSSIWTAHHQGQPKAQTIEKPKGQPLSKARTTSHTREKTYQTQPREKKKPTRENSTRTTTRTKDQKQELGAREKTELRATSGAKKRSRTVRQECWLQLFAN